MNPNTTSSVQNNNANNIDLNNIENIDDDNQGEDVKLSNSTLNVQPNSNEKKKAKCKGTENGMTNEQIVILERQSKIKADYADRMDKHYYKRKGFQFILACLIGYAVIVIIDSVLQTFFEIKISSYADGFIELLKYIISTLIGFVFADTRHKDEKEKEK